MKKKLFLFISFVFLGIVQAIIFMIVHSHLFQPYSLGACLLSLLYALPQACMVAAWAMVPVFFVGLVYVFIRGDWHRKFMVSYVPIVVVALLSFCLFDWVLYGFWGFRLDVTPYVYLFDDPLEALAQSPWWSFPLMAVLLFLSYWLAHAIIAQVYPKRRHGSISRMNTGVAQQNEALGYLLAVILSVIVGQGCFGLMGISSAYHTDQQPLNHASISPIYSLCHSIRQHRTPLSQQYRFMTEQERQQQMAQLQQLSQQHPAHYGTLQPDSALLAQGLVTANPMLLRPGITPNVLVLLLESFSGTACHYLYPEADPAYMPNVCRYMQQGVAFTRCYANSFRTERGIASVLAAWPGQPSYTIMNDRQRTAHLSYLTQPLIEAGYTTEFITGGDGHFTQLPHFLQCAGIDRQTSRDDFPAEQHDCEWGLHDGPLYTYLYDILEQEAFAAADTLAEYPAQPYFKVVPTISSHESFQVPMQRFDDPYLNAVCYADSCLGAFLDRLQADTLIWNNLLVVALADHAYSNYPEGIQQHEPSRYHIPMFWTGGAVAGHHDVDVLCQQTDLTLTLLHQLGIQPEAAQFPFSHDIFQPEAPHFAFYSWPDGYGFLTDSCQYVQDNAYDGHPLSGLSDPTGRAQRLGKAYLQTLYDRMGALGEE